MPEPLDVALAEIGALLGDPERLLRGVAAGRRRGAAPAWRRVEVRPVDLAAGRRLQVTRYDARQAFTANHGYDDGAAATVVADLLAEPFGAWHIETLDVTLDLRVTKRGEAQVHRGAPVTPPPDGRTHDRAKARRLDPADPVLAALGISDAQGRVIPRRADKWRQVEDFLRQLDVAIDDAGALLPAAGQRPLRLADLGCGNAYLTFAADAYLTAAGREVRLLGVDVKEQSRDRNTAIAERLGRADALRFVAASIGEVAADGRLGEIAGGPPDVAVALHACDTATDDAIAAAVRAGAPVVLAAPCCHHDLQRQLRARTPPDPYGPLLRHGILRERFADVLTDALRAQVLRLLGHRVDVVEFVATAHTPRNVLIRAIRTGAPAGAAAWAEYDALTSAWGVTPRLAVLLASELAAARPA